MPDYGNEDDLISKLVARFERALGGQWSDRGIRPDRAPAFQDIKAPDALLVCDSSLVAVELKGLHGSENWKSYDNTLNSLSRYLAPREGGRYLLSVPPLLELPLADSLKSQLRKSIQTVASKLGEGHEAILPIRRQAAVECLRPDHDARYVMCMHDAHGDDPVAEVSQRVSGVYMLKDNAERRLPHSFLTPEARADFQAKLIKACANAQASGEAFMQWQEDWRIQKSSSSLAAGVFLSGASTAEWVLPGLANELQREIDHASLKFVGTTWAPRQIIVLHRLSEPYTALEDIAAVQPHLKFPDKVDAVVLIEADRFFNLSNGKVELD